MNRSASRGFGLLHLLAVGSELLPFAGIVIWLSAAKSDSLAGVLIGYALILVTGIGWGLAGRWRVGFVVALTRFVMIYAALYIFGRVAISYDECHCDQAWSIPAFTLFAVTFAGTTLGSATALAWFAWRDARRQDD